MIHLIGWFIAISTIGVNIWCYNDACKEEAAKIIEFEPRYTIKENPKVKCMYIGIESPGHRF